MERLTSVQTVHSIQLKTFLKKFFSQAVTEGLVTFIICIRTEISDQHRQTNHVSHTFRELLPHTALADMLHDYQIQCTGTGQQTNLEKS